MLQHIGAVYQRIMRLPGVSARRSASLNVDALEDRCTPAISAGLLPLLHPPEAPLIVQTSFAPVLPHAEPVLAISAHAGVTAEASLVRTDLFGGAGDEQTEEESGVFGPIHESAFDWNDRPQPKATAPPTRASEAKRDADETPDHRRDNQESERLAPCVVLEYDAQGEAE